jgi:hypothetical protein
MDTGKPLVIDCRLHSRTGFSDSEIALLYQSNEFEAKKVPIILKEDTGMHEPSRQLLTI